MRNSRETDVLVIGTGIGGCSAALAAADAGCRVIMVTRGAGVEKSSTVRAQGGIIYRGKNDSAAALMKDIMAAGDGLCDPVAVKQLATKGPPLVREMLINRAGVPFDRTKHGGCDLTREGGHGIARIIHCSDWTGRSIAHALWDAVRAHGRITVIEHQTAVDLLTTSHHSHNPVDVYRPITCVGAYVLDNRSHHVGAVIAKQTVLASGGLGQVYLHTTNSEGARGDGYAMALRAGARLANMEYVQFHPTTLHGITTGNFLITESLRGEGAALVDRKGRPFAGQYHPMGSLAPRDVVARAIHQEMIRQNEECMFLDISHKPAGWIMERFPNIYQACREFGVDITKGPIPVVPAAHYACGGIIVNLVGQTTINGLRAVGEVSCTGVHGANRLASTSLLEALVWGTWCGRDVHREISETRRWYVPRISPWIEEHEPVDPALVMQDWMIIRHTMWNYVGLVRSERRLRRAQRILRELQTEVEQFYRRATMTDQIIGLRNGLETARSILDAALRNPHSRGCHYIEASEQPL
ncbi:L-aspartate oxidase [bacterium]|nr:L-aspartate oxidase [bacterium]